MSPFNFRAGARLAALSSAAAGATVTVGVAATLCLTSASAQAQTPKRGGTAVMVLGTDPLSLSPDTTSSVPDVAAGCLIYDGLVRFKKGFEIVPGLAKKWDISADGLSYSFELEDATWHDGKPVTSEDVKFTLEEISSKFGPRFAAAGKFIDRIETPSPRNVVIRLKQPFGPFLFSLACEQNAAIMPAHILRGADILKHPAILTTPVGNGPFKIVDWVRGSHITLARNPNYWRKNEPYLDRVIIKIMPDASARVLALRAGEVDYIVPDYVPLNSVPMLQKSSQFTTQEVSYPGSDIIILNTRHAALSKPEVRQALLMAVDRQFIHDKVFHGLGGVPRSAFDTRLWAYNKSVDYQKMYPFDPAKARQMLDAAGVKAGADGTRFTMRLLFETAKPEWLPAAQALQRFWQAVGVKVVLEGAERPVILKRVYSDYDFEATLQTYTTLGDPALGIARTYTSESIKQGTNFNNAAQYSNAEIDKLFAEGRDASTQAARQKAYDRVQLILARDLPVLNLHQQPQFAVASSRLQGLWQAANQQWWGSVWMK
ncbi:MAG: ABC transporter substrate-binding protein [Burkholderiaceae bacterium]